MKWNDSSRIYILVGIIIFSLAGLVVANVLAKKQDEQFATNEAIYNEAVQLQQQNDWSGSWEAISKLTNEEANAENVNYLAAIVSANTGEVEQSAKYMQKTLDNNPYKVEDPLFMLQFAEILYGAGKYEEAKVVLARCQEAGWTLESVPTYQARVAELLQQIANQ